MLSGSAYGVRAQQHLRRFRARTVVAVALTALLLMVTGGDELAGQTADAVAPSGDSAAVVAEATGAIRDLVYGFYGLLPRLALVLVVLGAAWIVRHAVRRALRRTMPAWHQRAAAEAITSLTVYVAATVAVVSILAGDVRAMVGSVGLLGLAASWALQTPIESFSGWLVNAFRGYYRIGDRIAVGDVFGDVYRIDMLTTTVWEAGGPDKPVRAAQSTGALVTFPNWEVLRSNIVNYSHDFPYVWDEVTFAVSNESDLAYTIEVIEQAARGVLGDQMTDAARQYEELLRAKQLSYDVDIVPRVFLSLAEAWTDCTLRYLVPVRTRRRWASDLVLVISQVLALPEHASRIGAAYPRTEVRLRRTWTVPADPEESEGSPTA